MSAVILRRRKLGRTSTREIATSMANAKVVRNWKENEWPSAASFVFRWGCISPYPVDVHTTVNTADSIRWCSDKRQGRLDMQAAGVPVPLTMDVGAFYRWNGPADKQWVVRPDRHAQGRNLECGNYNEILPHLRTTLYGTGYISELIDKVAEYRVFVCQNRVVWVAQKTPGNTEDVAWNVARGGRFDNVRWGDWNTVVLDAALKTAKVSGTDFCGVDVMVDAEGNPFVLEVNSAPSQTSPYRQQCVAKAFDYIVTNGKEHFDDIDYSTSRTWKDYIHPALYA